MKAHRFEARAAAIGLVGGLALGIGAPAWAAGTVNVGLSTSLTGPVAGLGVSNKDGVQMAIDKINADGGLLGKQIKLLTADGQLKPNTGVTNARNFVLSDHVAAIFGPVSSAVGIAEAGVAAQYHVPMFFSVSNDVDQTGKAYSKYVFQVVPSTYMEPHAMAVEVAKLFKEHNWKTLYTIAPNYAFGHSTVEQFLDGLKQEGVNVEVVGQQWPQLGASDYTQYISAIMAKSPDFVFAAEYGGDLITFTKQAQGAGLFQKTHVLADYWPLALEALGSGAPAGAITDDRAPPFYSVKTQDMDQFAQAFHAKYNRWPGSWAILGYSAVQTWAEGVQKAGSFDGDKVVGALGSGATVKTIRGDFKIRECDHLAEVPVYMGALSSDLDSRYGRRIMTDVVALPPEKTMMSCKAKQATQPQS